MFGRRVFSLLVVLSIFLTAVSPGQNIRTAVPELDRDLVKHSISRIPPAQSTIREPSHIVHRPPTDTSGSDGFVRLVRGAGTIFSGTVTRVQRCPATRGQSIETVAVTFKVENAIRGAIAGRDFIVHEWIGMWSAGQHYRVGQRVLLFLYPQSKLGLTSSVAGPLGRFEVDAGGRVLLSAQHLSAFRKDPVLGGKSRMAVGDFALAVRQASEEELEER